MMTHRTLSPAHSGIRENTFRATSQSEVAYLAGQNNTELDTEYVTDERDGYITDYSAIND